MTKEIKRVGDGKLYKIMLGIKDSYSDDARLFVDFLKSTGGLKLGSLQAYAKFLDQEREGKRYSANTFNKRIIGAKQRIQNVLDRAELTTGQRYELEKMLNAVKLKKINSQTVEEAKILSPEEIHQLIEECTDKTVSLMMEFLSYTGVRVSEMLNVLIAYMTKHTVKRRQYYEIRIHGKGGKERFVVAGKDLV